MLAWFSPGRLNAGNIALLDAVITHTSSAHVHLGGCAPLTSLLFINCEQMATLMSTMITLTCVLSLNRL